MGKWMFFAIRLVLSVVFALIITRIFFDSASLLMVGGLAAALLGFAYIFEHTKKSR